jgi:hypothetical protein
MHFAETAVISFPAGQTMSAVPVVPAPIFSFVVQPLPSTVHAMPMQVQLLALPLVVISLTLLLLVPVKVLVLHSAEPAVLLKMFVVTWAPDSDTVEPPSDLN